MKTRIQSSSDGGEREEGNAKRSGGGGKMERKDVEKKRRLHMKDLCLKLSSLIPTTSGHHHRLRHGSSYPPSSTNKDAITHMDQLDCAAAYINQLKERIDELKRRRKQCQGAGLAAAAGSSAAVLPVIEVRCQAAAAALDVVLVSEAGKPFNLHEVIAAVEQDGGAEVVTASFSVVGGDKVFYTVHSQATTSMIGVEASRISRRLKGLACASTAIHPSSQLF